MADKKHNCQSGEGPSIEDVLNLYNNFEGERSCLDFEPRTVRSFLFWKKSVSGCAKSLTCAMKGMKRYVACTSAGGLETNPVYHLFETYCSGYEGKNPIPPKMVDERGVMLKVYWNGYADVSSWLHRSWR